MEAELSASESHKEGKQNFGASQVVRGQGKSDLRELDLILSSEVSGDDYEKTISLVSRGYW